MSLFSTEEVVRKLLSSRKSAVKFVIKYVLGQDSDGKPRLIRIEHAEATPCDKPRGKTLKLLWEAVQGEEGWNTTLELVATVPRDDAECAAYTVQRLVETVNNMVTGDPPLTLDTAVEHLFDLMAIYDSGLGAFGQVMLDIEKFELTIRKVEPGRYRIEAWF